MKKITLKLLIAAVLIIGSNVNMFAQLFLQASPNQGCAPLTVTYTLTGTYGGEYRYEWNFQDGSPIFHDTIPFTTTLNHSFSNPGYYNAVVSVFDANNNYISPSNCNNCSVQAEGININATDSACANDPVNFCLNGGQVNSVSWNFGDGGTSNDQCTSHAYTSNATYTVTLTTNSFCGTKTTTKTIYVSPNAYPHPNAWTLSNTSCPTVPVSFNTDTYASYSWNFGDPASGTNNTSNLKNPFHLYATPGTYTATLIVQNGCGLSGSATTQTIIISTNPPFPNQQWFNLQSNSPSTCPNSNVGFNAPNGYNNYEWNFGDGSPVATTTDSYNNHFYGTSLGAKTVSVKITSPCGNDTTLYTTVTVTNTAPWPNYPEFKLENQSLACPNSNIGFNAPHGYNTYVWNFGDGSPSLTTSANHANHTYGTATIQYNPSVTITNGCGNDTTLSSNLQITNTAPWPNQYFDLNVNSPSCPNSNVNFNAPQGYSKYEWTFGDGSPMQTTGDNYVNHIYGNTLGVFNVSVKITSACGNDTTITTSLTISNSAPFPNQSWFQLEAGPNPACPNDNVNFNAPHGYSTYEWTFGDGSPSLVTNQNYNHHIYGNSGTTFTASVKITNGCGNDTTLIKVINISPNAGWPTDNWFQLQVNSPACPNSNAGFQAPGGYSKYVWNFGDNSPLVTSSNNNYNHVYGMAIQTYTVSVKITNGCGNDTTLYSFLEIKNNVGFPNDDWFKVEGGPSPSCPGDQVNFNAPNGYSNYFWKFGDGDSISSSQSYAHHVYAVANTYTYSVKIVNACGKDTTLYGTIVVNTNGSFYSGLAIYTNPGTTSCPNDLIHFKLNQNGFQSYFWDFGDGDTITTNGNDIQHAFDTVGIFSISCKVKNGCGVYTTIYTSVQVTNNSPVNGDLSVSGIQNPSCPGDNVFFVINNGQGTTKYLWNYGDGSPIDTTIGSGSSHIYTSPGTDTVTVMATNACGMTKTIKMVQTVSTTITPTLTGEDGRKTFGYPGGEGNNTTAGCAGDAIVFYFMGDAANNVWDFGDGQTGTATEHVLIDGGDGSFPITIIKHVFAANGTYTITLTLTNNCGNSVTDSFTVNIGGNQIVNGDMVTSPPPFTTCGSIDFLAFGGSSYAWNFGDGSTLNSPSPTVSHTFSTQGVYVVTVVITNGCLNTATYSKSVNVNGVGGPSISLLTSTNPNCVNGTDGSATVSVTDGQAPYTYLWDDQGAQTTATASGLAPGVYYATVTDNIGCASDFAVSITNPAPIVLSSTSTQSACGLTTGSATVSVTSGGTAPFTYLWNGGSTAATATNLGYGLKTVTVTDFVGCTSTANVSVSEVNTPTITLGSVTNSACYGNGSANGAITIAITGGTTPYTYAWSNSATTQNLSNLVAGTYSLLVTDGSNCKATFNATVGEPDSLKVVAASTVSPTCGNFDGAAKATVTGGVAPYTYLWDSGSQTTQTATSLPAGTYSVVVTDAHGCTKSGTVSLSNSNAPNITAVVTDVSCFNGSNGAINISVTGGNGSYLYTWNVAPPQTNLQDLTNLLPGNYLIFVNDAQGCTSIRSYTIAQPALLTATVTNTGAGCNQSDGTALVVPAGGNSPYTYLWTGGGQTDQTATGLALGSYSVTVTDNKGCMATDSTTIATEVPTPDICMVTVDELSVNNVIYWDKTTYTNVDSFIVYREVSTALYKRIGAVAYSALSEFTDTTRSVGPANGNPNVGAYLYKLQLLDDCGNYSGLSLFHKTVFITGPDNFGTFQISPMYEIENQVTPVTNYVLICDTTNNTIPWFGVGTVAGTVSSVTDADYATHKNNANAQWRVKSDWSITCDPTRAPINTTRSNIKRPGISIGILSIEGLDAAVSIYPNPAKDNVTIELSSLTENAQLKIVNVLGQAVYSENIIASSVKTVKQINTANFAKGVYTVVVETNKAKVLKKLVVN